MSQDKGPRWAVEEGERRADAQEWARRLTESIGWLPDDPHEMMLGAVQFDLPVVFVDDPSKMGVWTMSTLTVAPLEDVALWLHGPGAKDRVGIEILGELAREVEIADAAVFEARKAEHAASMTHLAAIPGFSVGGHMSFALMCRNAADYRAAGVGEPITLDPLRKGGGGKAILCAKILGSEGMRLDFDKNAAQAFANIERALGPLAFHHQSGSGRLSGCPVRRPASLSRAWPASMEEWKAMRDARNQALELSLEIAALPAKPGSILRM